MYTLSLDEYGDFENLKDENKPIFIGGIIYDDKGIEHEANREKKRIRAYYKAIAEEVSKEIGWQVVYPRNFHIKNTKDEEARLKNLKEVGMSKQKVTETLGEFLQRGTFRGNKLVVSDPKIGERQGEYRIYVVFKSDEGVTKRAESENIYLNDQYASNLYSHMASSVINRAVFNNTYTDMYAEFSLLFASRSSGNIDRNGKLANEYRKLGYNGITQNSYGNKQEVLTYDGKPGIYFALTNDDIYRTAVSHLSANNNPLDARVSSVNTKSIQYSVNPDSKYSYEFYYMADSVCSVLSYELEKNRKRAESRFKELNKRAERLLPKDKLLIFAYDDIDEVFGEALNSYLIGDYYKALKITYDFGHKKAPYSEFYKDEWFSFIVEKIVDSKDIRAFKKLVSDYKDAHFSNDYDPNRGMYILEIMERLANNIRSFIKTAESESIYAQLYEAAMVSYCHIGDSKNAEKYYKMIIPYAYALKVENLIRIRDMLCVCYSDSFMWDKALKMAKKNVKTQAALSDIKRTLVDKKYSEGFLGEAKSLSQSGQVYAFCRDAHAEKYFIKAMNIFKEKSANYYITMSYLLHYYIDQKMEDKYKDLAYEFFGNNKDLEAQFEYIFKEGFSNDPLLNVKFALYVYLKALYVFDKDKITDSLWVKVSKIENYVNEEYTCFKGTWELDGHPTELIKKYVALLASDRKDIKIAKANKEKLIKMIDGQNTIVKFITWISVIDICKTYGDTRCDEMILELVSKLADTYESFAKIKNIKKTSEIYKVLKTYFTYMYC